MKSMSWRQLLMAFLIAVMMLASAQNVRASSGDEEIEELTPCELVGNAKAVFIGSIIDYSNNKGRDFKTDFKLNGEVLRPIPSFKLRVSILESFFGINGSQTEVTTLTGSTVIVKGEIYLIYLYEVAAFQSAKILFSRLVPLKDAEKELAYLRQPSIRSEGARFYGEINESMADAKKISEKETEKRPVSGVTIKVLDNEGKQIDITPDSHGRYEFSGLKPGKYQVTISAPDYYNQENLQTEIEIGERGCFRKDFTLRLDGCVSGQVVDFNGQPVTNTKVFLVAADLKQRRSLSEERLSASTDNNGNYQIKEIPPGKYLLSFKLLSKSPDDYEPYSRSYYPGVDDRAQATIINVAAGEKLNNYNFNLPPKFTLGEIHGKVVWSDGSPVETVNITLHDQAYPQLIANTTRDTNNGKFSLNGYLGLSYVLQAESLLPALATTENPKGAVKAESTPFLLTSDLDEIIIVLPKPKSPGDVNKAEKLFDR